MNPSPAAIALINTFVNGLQGGWNGNTDAQVVATANLANVANPIPQGTVPAPFTVGSLLSQCSAASRKNLAACSLSPNVLIDVQAQNVANCVVWWSVLSGAAVITSAEATALTTTVNATELDPNWPSLVGWAQANLGRALDLNDSAITRVIQ